MENFRRALKEMKRFDASYYDQLLDTVDRYVSEKPDITIETCKAIIEGLSKLTLSELKQTPDSYFRSPELTLSRLFKEARNCLSEAIEKDERQIVYDAKIVDSFGGVGNILGQLMPAEALARIGSLRNEHGDISHGRSPLKLQINDEDLAELIVGITDRVGSYMLRKLNQVTEPILRYQDNPEFNDYLDKLFPLSSSVRYSLALFDQEPETYEVELGDFLVSYNDDAQ